MTKEIIKRLIENALKELESIDYTSRSKQKLNNRKVHKAYNILFDLKDKIWGDDMELEMDELKKLEEACNKFRKSAEEANKSILVNEEKCTIAIMIFLYPELKKYYYIYRRTKKKRIAKKMKNKIYRYRRKW